MLTGRKRARKIVTTFHKLEEELKRSQADESLTKPEKKQRLERWASYREDLSNMLGKVRGAASSYAKLLETLYR